MKYLQSPNSTNAYGLYGDQIGPGHLVAIIEFEPSADGAKLIRPIASAPALLAACEATIAFFENLNSDGETEEEVEYPRLLSELRAAVAEARGEAG